MNGSESAPDLEAARRLAAAAGLRLTGERLEAFTSSLPRNLDLVRPLLTMDYGATEPASRFRPPSPAT